MGISVGMALVSTATSAAAGSYAFGTALFSLGIGTAMSHFLVTTALGVVLNALAPKPSTSGTNRGYQVTGKSPAPDHAVIYGRTRVGGAIVYEGTTGTNNKYLHQVIAFAGHRVQSFDEVFLDGEKLEFDAEGVVTGPEQFVGKVRVNFHKGFANQDADADLVAEVEEWTEKHRLRGIAYAYFRFAFDPDSFPNGVPSVTATIKGKRVYDPRTNSTGWSDNPALIVRDYLVNDTYGLGEPSTNIDGSSFKAAANKCEATDTISGDPWFTCNGSFLTSASPDENLNALLSSMGGLLWYGQGQWKVKAAEWVEPAQEYTLDDMRGPIKVQTRHSRRDNFNTVKGTFRGEESDWQPTDYPPVTNNAFLNADGGQESVADVELPFTDNSKEARRIARINLERNRQQLTVDISTSLKGLNTQVGDNIWLTIPRYGWNKKLFEVVSWTLSLGDDLQIAVNMTVRETAQSIFDEVSDGIVYERDNTTLLSPFDVPSIGLEITPFAQVLDEKVVNSVEVLTLSSRPEGIDHVEVQLKQLTKINKKTGVETEVNKKWISLGTGELGVFGAQDLDRGTWNIRARAINTFGIRGQWVSVERLLNSDDQKPENVENFTKAIAGSTLFLSWSPVADQDLSYYQIKYNSSTTGANWDNSQTLVEKIARPATTATVIVRSGTYLIRAWDKLGQPSEDATSLTVLPSEVPKLGTVIELQQDPSFLGVKNNVTIDTSYNPDRLLGGNLFGPNGNRGTYYLYNGDAGGVDYVDSGSVKPLYITSTATLYRYQPNAGTWNNIPQNMLTWPGVMTTWTNEDANFADYWYELQYSTTEDDPAGTPTWSDWETLAVGVINARAVRLRVRLKSENLGVAPMVEKLTFNVEY